MLIFWVSFKEIEKTPKYTLSRTEKCSNQTWLNAKINYKSEHATYMDKSNCIYSVSILFIAIKINNVETKKRNTLLEKKNRA